MDPARLDAMAARAWPAETEVELDGWRLRAMQGVTRRGNSVLANGAHGALSRDERLAVAESFYDERGLARLFQVGPAAPDGLDAELERRGYRVDAPVSLQTAALRTVCGHAATSGHALRVETEPSADLLHVLGRRGRYEQVLPVFQGLLHRLAGRVVYAIAYVDRTPTAAGFVVIEANWAGVFSMRTQPEARGQGLGRAVLGVLAAEAMNRNATHAYLQVERGNPAALRLYARSGFVEQYGYHYRRHPEVSG